MRQLRTEFRQSAKPEMTVPQHRILAHILGGAQTAAELAELQGVSLPAISKMVEFLVERGYLKREFRSGNRKQVFLHLTPQGRARYQKTRDLAQERLAPTLAQATAQEREVIIKGLQTLHALMNSNSTS